MTKATKSKPKADRAKDTAPATPPPPPPNQPPPPRPDSKIGKVVALLERKDGATLDELVNKTGWQPHTARAALTGLKKRGFAIERSKRGDDPALIASLRRAHRMLDWSKDMPSLAASPVSPYDRKILRLTLLAPALQRDILQGHQPPTLTFETLKSIDIPICWKAQRKPWVGASSADAEHSAGHSLFCSKPFPAPRSSFPATQNREFDLDNGRKVEEILRLALVPKAMNWPKNCPKTKYPCRFLDKQGNQTDFVRHRDPVAESGANHSRDDAGMRRR